MLKWGYLDPVQQYFKFQDTCFHHVSLKISCCFVSMITFVSLFYLDFYILFLLCTTFWSFLLGLKSSSILYASWFLYLYWFLLNIIFSYCLVVTKCSTFCMSKGLTSNKSTNMNIDYMLSQFRCYVLIEFEFYQDPILLKRVQVAYFLSGIPC